MKFSTEQNFSLVIFTEKNLSILTSCAWVHMLSTLLPVEEHCFLSFPPFLINSHCIILGKGSSKPEETFSRIIRDLFIGSVFLLMSTHWTTRLTTLSPCICRDTISISISPRIMAETRWCNRQNRFEDFGKGIIPIALLPCKGESCKEWETGPMKRCIHLVRVEKGRRF